MQLIPSPQPSPGWRGRFFNNLQAFAPWSRQTAHGSAQQYIRLTAYTAYRILPPMHINPETLFTALAHPLRLRSLMLLTGEGELCVCELTHVLGVAQPTVSRHLAGMREAGIVVDRREGLWVYYRLHPELPDWASRILEATASAVSDDEVYRRDRQALADMPNRPVRCCA